VAGDIGGTIKLKHTATAHTLHTPGKSDQAATHRLPRAHLRQVIKATDPKAGGEAPCCVVGDPEGGPHHRAALQRETSQQTRRAQGELHLNLLKWKLNHHYKVEPVFSARASPTARPFARPAEASYRHKKQTGGSGQFGEVHLKIEPWYEGMPEPHGHSVRGKEEYDLPTGGKLIFYNCIVGGVIDNKFMPSILKGVMEKMERGPLTGSPARDIRVIVYDGKMHAVDSNDISFKIAGLACLPRGVHHWPTRS
jgi:elongation factor G